MFIVAYIDTRDDTHINMLRAVDDEDIAHELAFQYALHEFGDADNIDMCELDAHMFSRVDLPNMVDAFTDKFHRHTAFAIFSVQHRRRSNQLF